MTKYSDQSFSKRLNTMGDISEGIFESISPMGKWARFGWNRPPVPMAKMSEMLRHTPDYYTANGYLIEVGGLGRDSIFKLKLSKYEALAAWNKVQPVKLFVFNSSLSEWALIGWPQLKRLVTKARKAGVQKFENDGNEYYAIDWEWVEGKVPYE